jgi:transketolase
MTELGQKNENVVALCADLIGSLKFDDFEKSPRAFFQIVAEANMIGIAAGLTIGGKIHLQELSLTSQQEECMTKFVNLSPTLTKRSCAGLTLGEDGATHQSWTLV